MKLELKNLSAYLPYDIRVEVKCDEEVYKSTLVGFGYFDKELHALCGNKIHNGLYHINGEEYIKPILRPISDLTKEIEVNGEKFIPLYKLISEDRTFTTSFIYTFGYEELKVSVYELLLKWHFDVFGLIEKGLGIDINTLNK